MHWSWTFLQDHVICLKLAVILVSGLQQLKRASNVQRISVFARDVTKEEDAKRLMDYIETKSDSGPRSLCSKLWHFFEGTGNQGPRFAIERQPQPLRSNEHPDGLPHLLEADQKRVCAANDSYSAMVTLILFLITFGIGVSIENPRNSILWLCSTMTKLFDQFWVMILSLTTVCKAEPFLWPAPCAFRRVTTFETYSSTTSRSRPRARGIDPRLAVYARS